MYYKSRIGNDSYQENEIDGHLAIFKQLRQRYIIDYNKNQQTMYGNKETNQSIEKSIIIN